MCTHKTNISNAMLWLFSFSLHLPLCLYRNSLKYFCSRNTQFSFAQLHNDTITTTTATPVNTISRQTFDAQPNQQSLSHSLTTSHDHHQIYSDPPPPYDEIVLDIPALSSPNTALVY